MPRSGYALLERRYWSTAPLDPLTTHSAKSFLRLKRTGSWALTNKADAAVRALVETRDEITETCSHPYPRGRGFDVPA